MGKRGLFKNGEGNIVSISFKVDDSLYAQLKCIAEEREWTIRHVLMKLVPLGMDKYLELTTLPPFPDTSEEA